MSVPMLSSLVPTAPGTRLTIEQTVEQIEETVVVRARHTETTDVAVAGEHWEWHQLRDYVIRQIERIQGQVPRQPDYKEKAIFSGFITRHGSRSAQIAKYAFEVAGGYWKNAPVSINRFCQASDPYFSDIIKRHLDEVEQAAAARL